MVNIDLTPQQIEELKKYYESELEQMRKRTDEFQRLLIKLDTKSSVDSMPSAPPDKDKVKPVLTVPPTKVIKEIKPKDTKNPHWRSFIMTVLKEQNRPLSIKDILKLYKIKNNKDVSKSKNSNIALSQALFILRRKNKLINSFLIKGKSGKYYGLIGQDYNSILTTDNAKAKKPVQLNDIKPTPTPNNKPDKKRIVRTRYNWSKFVFDTLNKEKRVLSAKEIVKYAMVRFSIPKKDFEITRTRLSPTLSRLEKNLKKLKTCKKDRQTGRFYGLPNWFDGDNKLKAQFK